MKIELTDNEIALILETINAQVLRFRESREFRYAGIMGEIAEKIIAQVADNA